MMSTRPPSASAFMAVTSICDPTPSYETSTPRGYSAASTAATSSAVWSMTRCAPRLRTSSALRAAGPRSESRARAAPPRHAPPPQVATTCAPAATATCTAKWPVPPAAAVTSTTSPACTRAVARNEAAAVTPLMVHATASGVAAGTRQQDAAGASTNSEKAPCSA